MICSRACNGGSITAGAARGNDGFAALAQYVDESAADFAGAADDKMRAHTFSHSSLNEMLS